MYGFSIIWIMLFHAKAILDLRYDTYFKCLLPLDAVLGWGNIGVDIFLFLSGIGLYFSFHKTQDIRKYVRHRIQRLWLPAIVIDGWYWLIFVCIAGGDFYTFICKASLLNFWISGDTMIWYVSLMVFLYIIFPYIYCYLYAEDSSSKWRWLKAVLLITAVILLNKSFSIVSAERWTDYEIALTRIPVFIAGVCMGRPVYKGRKVSSWIYAAAAGSLAVGIYTICFGMLQDNLSRYRSGLMGIAIVILLEFVFSHVKTEIIHRLFCFFGKLSLELYLSHILIIYIYRESVFGIDKRLSEYVAVMALAIIAAYLGMRICNHIKDTSASWIIFRK